MNYRLRACRLAKGYTQDEIASVLGITRAAYSHYENERRLIPIDLLIMLANFYDCTTDELLGSNAYHKSLKRRKDA